MDCLKSCIGLDYVKVLGERKYSRFIAGLIGDARYFNLLLAYMFHTFLKIYLNECVYCSFFILSVFIIQFLWLHLIAKKINYK